MSQNHDFLIRKIGNKSRFVLIDVGAMGGLPQKWQQVLPGIHVVGFEPDQREFNALRGSSQVTYLNYALHDTPKELNFYITKQPGKSSIYRPNIHILNSFHNAQRFEVVREEKIAEKQVSTLDLVAREQAIMSDVDFIKVDTQGSELAILQGGRNMVLPQVFGLQIEIEFIEMYKGQPLFGQVHEFMSNNGFDLWDMNRHFWKRNDFSDYSGKGQLIFCDALYLKKPDVFFSALTRDQDTAHRQAKIYKAVLVCLVYGLFDYAVAISKMALDSQSLEKDEHASLVSYIKTESRRGAIPMFAGRDFLSKAIGFLNRILRSKSYLGFADSDQSIGNVKDR